MDPEAFKEILDRLLAPFNPFASKALYDAYFLVLAHLTPEVLAQVVLEILNDPDVKRLPLPAEIKRMAERLGHTGNLLPSPTQTGEPIVDKENLKRMLDEVKQRAAELMEQPKEKPTTTTGPVERMPVAITPEEWEARKERLKKQAAESEEAVTNRSPETSLKP